MVSGLLLLAAALCLAGYNVWDEQRAEAETEQVLTQVLRQLPTPPPEGEKPDEPPPEEAAEKEIPDYVLFPEMEMPTVEVDGHEYIGMLTIPALGLELPVMSQWSYPKLRIAPCRYAGSAYTDDMVLSAHNYQRHFGLLKNLEPGTAVEFTDADGNKFVYQVESIETLEPTAIEEMRSGDWALTMFTCTQGGQARVAVRCSRSQ